MIEVTIGGDAQRLHDARKWCIDNIGFIGMSMLSIVSAHHSGIGAQWTIVSLDFETKSLH